jgi:hypothetical protein
MRCGHVLFALLCLLQLVAGCGSGQIPTYPVKGQILVNGEPAKGVHVTFRPRGDGENAPYFPSGQTDDDGYFVLSTFTTGDGSPAGEYDVTLFWPLRKNPLSTLWEGDRFNGKYKDKTKPFTQVTVEKRAQELEPFNLSDKPK